ncbi:PREDICTED: NHL repeat-containing protein 2 [Drosophila arizonae]|uniref:NHL repeat-containing protein 2 n=1 Tax=Drosophila arizonae TaxID=7263 RepID=A0ABM1NU25_DROAR|nr:PREDICTED: NHL repeat-containing protein 2 [Drosophila arizonae]
MDNSEEFSAIDIVTFVTEQLQQNYLSNRANKAKIFDEFLGRWDTNDSSLAKVKSLNFEFETDLDWFNVSRPLTLAGLRGKLVVLDFFTYCCINCMHVLPELRALEERFPVESGLVVVGVHSPKFENERTAANILSAAQRYGIKHPIVNDSQSALWRALSIRCWPSLLVLSPSGMPMLLLMGEGHGEFLRDFAGEALSFFDRQQKLNFSSLPLQLSTDLLPASNLRFPAKIAMLEDQYAIADAGNNRIIVVTNCGVVKYKIGGLEAGFVDGSLNMARFNNPQGVAFLDKNTLIVADTDNHALRQISLNNGVVETLAGTGSQGNERIGGKLGPLQPLSSPWDVSVFRTRDMDMSFHLDELNVPEKTIVLIAMAGTHQIWGYFPEGIIWWKFRKFEPRCCVALIGNGLEENRNNSYPQNAAFAQPSGLAMSSDYLYIADSESSSIRKASMVDGKVMPVVGGDRNPLNLFAFGDEDGKLYNAKLQHPLGVSYNNVDKKLYVADTYNHKIKQVDTETNIISTLTIKNKDGSTLALREPSGLCVDADRNRLLVADTNNHGIHIIDLASLTAEPFLLDFNQITNTTETDAPRSLSKISGLELVKKIPVLHYRNCNINFSMRLSSDLKFTPDAPQKWMVKFLNPELEINQLNGILAEGKCSLQLNNKSSRSVRTEATNQNDLTIEFALSLCDSKSCLIKKFTVSIVSERSAEGSPLHPTIIKDNTLDVDIGIHINQSNINFC